MDQRERLRRAVWPIWAKAKDAGQSQEAFARENGLGTQSGFAGFIGKSPEEPGRQGMSLSKAVAFIRRHRLDGRAILGSDWPDDSASLRPIDRVRSLEMYAKASPAVRERFDALRNFRRTPDGAEVENDDEWFVRRLTSLIDDERAGVELVPPKGELVQAADEPTPPRPRASRRRG